MGKSTMFLLLGLLCSAATFAGMTYVLVSGGAKSPGYAVIPMIFAVTFLQLWNKGKKTANNKGKKTANSEIK